MFSKNNVSIHVIFEFLSKSVTKSLFPTIVFIQLHLLYHPYINVKIYTEIYPNSIHV